MSIDRSTAAPADFLASRSFFTCSDVLRHTLPFSVSVEGLPLTAVHVGHVDMMDGVVDKYSGDFSVDIIYCLFFIPFGSRWLSCSSFYALIIP